MKNIKIIFTGGTIAMRTDETGMLVPATSGEDLIAAIPALREMAEISTSQFSNIPSAQIKTSHMLALRKEIIDSISNHEISGVVVVHGTDTMEETAFFLDATLSNLELDNKPVILTGAMRSNDQAFSDGADNLKSSVQTAIAEESRGRGVMLVMNHEIHAARYVKKMDTSRVNAFASPHHMSLGSCTQSSGIRYRSAVCRFTPVAHVSRETTELPRVDIVSMHTDADATLLDAAIHAGARAIVIQAVGASSVNLELYEGIANAIEKGIHVIISSRSPMGLCTPVYGYKGGGKTLEQLGALFAHDLPAHKARLYAMLWLNADIAEAFKKLNNNSNDWNYS
ncbi:MAG: asparaginase [Formosimonas sp.]